MVELRNKIAFIPFALFFFSLTAFSQGKINVPARECLGNITSFSYTPPSGLTLSSASWNFGDGATSTINTPSHSYASTGKYKIIIQATFTNSTTAKDSQEIEVMNLPKAGFSWKFGSDSCYSHNRVCYIDDSKPANSTQPIKRRLFVWGDGSFDLNTKPKDGDSLCHSYTVMDKYNLRIEVTDTYGCKSSLAGIINIVKNVDADFGLDPHWLDCKTMELCVKNGSTGAASAMAHYNWFMDTSKLDTFPHFTSAKCLTYKVSRSGKVTMIADARNGCTDTMSKTFSFLMDALPTSMSLLDTLRCFTVEGLNEAEVKPASWSAIVWSFDNQIDPLQTKFKSFFSTKTSPGIHTVKADIYRGSCVTSFTRTYTIKGPLASAFVIDREQCFSNREVFFVDNSKGINRKDCIFRWIIFDPYGLNCTNNRIKDINKYTNCNKSVDWFTKHRFNKNVKDTFIYSFYIKDTVSGCDDSTEGFVNMKDCWPLLDRDSMNVCERSAFLNNTPSPNPIKFTLDSGKTWKDFGTDLDSNLKIGMYTVGFVFKTYLKPWAETIGDDSIKVHPDSITYYDTIYKKDYLYIRGAKTDSMTLKVYGKCKPYRATIFFRKGLFLKNEYMYINWADSGAYENTFTKDTQLDSVSHVYNSSGAIAFIRVTMASSYGCISRTSLEFAKGKFLSKYSNPDNCSLRPVCFVPYVYDTKIMGFWTGNTPYNKVSWKFSDTSAPTTQFAPCHKFTSGGKHEVQMIVVDSNGCKDTLRDSLFIQDLHANVKTNSKFIYCSELKQFFDSSSFIPYKGDTIKRYAWQFGDGVFSSFQKNPLQSLNTSLDKIPVTLAVETVSGCVDTFRFDIKVIGSKPYFNIRDTIGCGSLNAMFLNLSRNCKHYIWQFGDSMKSSQETFDELPVTFKYNKPGRYFISLIGIDTIFNPFTNSMQYCYNTFPDKVFQKDTTRSVLVLPYNKTGISSKDTICLGSPITFISKSDTAYDFDYWYMGDTAAALKLNAGSSHTYQYKKAGSYNVRLSPYYNKNINNVCRDSAQKNILVLGVKADFDIDPANIPPIFLFHNKSIPANASLRWDFGHPNSGSFNSSSAQDPTHTYDRDTGTFTICLIADLPEGCSDTICKTIFNDHMDSFGIFNVFTPGLLDGKNDQYDILIGNEDLYHLQVYDRWGVLVYEGREDADNTQNLNWNGKVFNKGPECPGGTYYYIFRYSLRQKPAEIKTISGVITLIR